MLGTDCKCLPAATFTWTLIICLTIEFKRWRRPLLIDLTGKYSPCERSVGSAPAPVTPCSVGFMDRLVNGRDKIAAGLLIKDIELDSYVYNQENIQFTFVKQLFWQCPSIKVQLNCLVSIRQEFQIVERLDGHKVRGCEHFETYLVLTFCCSALLQGEGSLPVLAYVKQIKEAW